MPVVIGSNGEGDKYCLWPVSIPNREGYFEAMHIRPVQPVSMFSSVKSHTPMVSQGSISAPYQAYPLLQ